MTNPIENSEEIRNWGEAKRTFAELSSSKNLGFKKNFLFIARAKVKPLTRLNLATGANKRIPLMLVELLSKKNLDAACGIGRAGLRIEPASARGVQASRNYAAVVKNKQITRMEQIRQIAEEVIAILTSLTIKHEHTARPTYRRRRLSDKLFRKIEVKVGYTHCLILVRRGRLCCAGLRQFDRVVKYGLYSGLFGGNLRGPGYGDTREWLRDEEAVPGTEFPGLLRVDVEGAYGGIDEFGQLGNAGLGDLSRSTGPIGCNGTVVSGEIGALKIAETAGAIA